MEAALNGIALEDDKREEFNKIEQVRFTLVLLISMWKWDS